jgi:hypothetical protein
MMFCTKWLTPELGYFELHLMYLNFSRQPPYPPSHTPPPTLTRAHTNVETHTHTHTNYPPRSISASPMATTSCLVSPLPTSAFTTCRGRCGWWTLQGVRWWACATAAVSFYPAKMFFATFFISLLPLQAER